ncbi:hypothetical protein TNCV_952131 [Trichonephila clavipes]|nr:hypothetical protein TNCV_952131 [Trichonephila clavipes]
MKLRPSLSPYHMVLRIVAYIHRTLISKQNRNPLMTNLYVLDTNIKGAADVLLLMVCSIRGFEQICQLYTDDWLQSLIIPAILLPCVVAELFTKCLVPLSFRLQNNIPVSCSCFSWSDHRKAFLQQCLSFSSF